MISRAGHRTRAVVVASSAGFSLVEILVALAIFLFFVLGAGTATLTSMRANRLNEQVAVATAIAQDVLECLKEQRERRAGTMTGACNPNALPPRMTVTPVVQDLGGMLRFTVTVTWQGSNPGTITLDTLHNV